MDPCSEVVQYIYVHRIHKRVREKGCRVSCQAGSRTGDMRREGVKQDGTGEEGAGARSSSV